MLALTDAATRVIRHITSDPEEPDVSGLRIARTPGGLTVSPAGSSAEGDQVIEEQGARVLLEPDAAQILDDKVLDADIDDEGNVTFMVADQ